eukprot:2827651-Rhodomonas_salina.3
MAYLGFRADGLRLRVSERQSWEQSGLASGSTASLYGSRRWEGRYWRDAAIYGSKTAIYAGESNIYGCSPAMSGGDAHISGCNTAKTGSRADIYGVLTGQWPCHTSSKVQPPTLAPKDSLLASRTWVRGEQARVSYALSGAHTGRVRRRPVLRWAVPIGNGVSPRRGRWGEGVGVCGARWQIVYGKGGEKANGSG